MNFMHQRNQIISLTSTDLQSNFNLSVQKISLYFLLIVNLFIVLYCNEILILRMDVCLLDLLNKINENENEKLVNSPLVFFGIAVLHLFFYTTQAIMAGSMRIISMSIYR